MEKLLLRKIVSKMWFDFNENLAEGSGFAWGVLVPVRNIKAI